jgi:hypothetical protein
MRESSKSGYGLNQAEFLASNHPDFLREGRSKVTGGIIFQLTGESEAIGDFHGKPYGDGMIIVEEIDHGGAFEHGIHKSKADFK